MATKRSLWEQETIITYNQEEGTANCYTFDRKLIRKLDELCATTSTIMLKAEFEGGKEYIFPKKWIKIQKPRELSEKQKRELAQRARDNFHGGTTNENI